MRGPARTTGCNAMPSTGWARPSPYDLTPQYRDPPKKQVISSEPQCGFDGFAEAGLVKGERIGVDAFVMA